jgi:hypothetical protein
MNVQNHWTWLSVLLVAQVVGTTYSQWTSLVRDGLDAQRRLEGLRQERAKLDGLQEATNRRIHAKERTIRELMAGQVSLAEAIVAFHTINQAGKAGVAGDREVSGRTDPVCREVLFWSENSAGQRPCSQAEPVEGLNPTWGSPAAK